MSVLLPYANPSQAEAGADALRWLLQKYPDATVVGSSRRRVDGSSEDAAWWPQYESPGSHPSVEPSCHGVWMNSSTGKAEYDSHLMFVTYVSVDTVSLPSVLAALEEALCFFYYAVARRRRERLTYQRLVFIEAWPGVHVTLRRRHDLTDTID